MDQETKKELLEIIQKLIEIVIAEKASNEELLILVQRLMALIENDKSSNAVPIPPWIARKLKEDTKNYTLNSQQVISFIEPKIKLSTFYNLVRNSIGWRVYPALKNNNMIHIFCLSNSANDPNEIGPYYMLEQSDYINNPLPNPCQYNQIEQYLLNYRNQVLLERDAYLEGTSKKSRFYYTGELLSYLEDYPSLTDYTKCSLQFDFGYVTQFTNDAIFKVFYRTEFPSQNSPYYKDYHKGYTCMFTVFDEEDNPLDKTLEIGHPCPPQCGR